MSSYLGIDLGTGSAKAALIDGDGRRLGGAAADYQHEADRGGQREANPERWWAAVVKAVRQTLTVTRADEVAAIGVTGQMHGVVLCDALGRPLRPAITWADSRAAAQAIRVQSLPKHLLGRLGNPVSAGMAGPLLLWLAEHEHATYCAARWALQPKDWLRFRLTGRAAGDPSDASATLLYDVEADSWAFAIIDALGLRPDLLPTLGPSESVAGELRSLAADDLGLQRQLPVVVGAADAAAALVAAGLRTNEVLLNVGSGGQVIVPTDVVAVHPHRSTHAYRGAGNTAWYAMAAVQNAGVALEWTLDVLRSSWREVYDVALAQTESGADGLFFLPHLIGERKAQASELTAAWVGLRPHHDRRHMLRAAVEGVAFALRDALETLDELELELGTVWLSGGSARWEQWRELLADVLNKELRVPANGSSSAQGAALLAALALGHPLPAPVLSERAVEPHRVRAETYNHGYRRFLELRDVLAEPNATHTTRRREQTIC